MTTNAALLAGMMLSATFADGPDDNDPAKVRQVPPPGIELTDAQRQHFTARLNDLDGKLSPVAEHPLATDVRVLRRAVSTALEHQEFFSDKDLETADAVLDLAALRARELAKKHVTPSWTNNSGLTALGFESRLDGTVQPYGLVIPDSYRFDGEKAYRLDIWFHGRGETVSELRFVDQRLKQAGQYTPKDTFVLHPYGRYSNAFKFAGEIDVLEALADVQKRYRIDPDRISVRGFSMGGAGCWQFAVHYPDRWFAANPGAGFSETPEFLRTFQGETLTPTWYERRLWHMYDCTDYAINLFHCPTVAYSGEIDKQKQAADIMADALRKVDIDLLHVIGPETAHSIHPASKIQIERRMDELARVGRQNTPHEIHLQTPTLKYNRMHWLTIDALDQHWEMSGVDIRVVDDRTLQASARNVTAFTIDFDGGECPLRMYARPTLRIDRQTVELPQPKSDRSFRASLLLVDGAWKVAELPADEIRKRHNLQGPIDDAFMDAFVFVAPTGASTNDAVDNWARAELEHAVSQWRQQFRGDARIVKDTELTDEHIASMNLVLFGDPQSNAVLERLAGELPVQWSSTGITAGDREFEGAHHGLILIHPNPLNPERYVVLNSGFTYREYAYLNNARQVPMLPDWAVVDVRSPPTSQFPGKVVDADFFGEKWELQPSAVARGAESRP